LYPSIYHTHTDTDTYTYTDSDTQSNSKLIRTAMLILW